MFFQMSVSAWKTRAVSYYSEWNIRHKNRKAFVLRLLSHGSGKQCQGTVRWMHRIRAALDNSDTEKPYIPGTAVHVLPPPASRRGENLRPWQ